jgi:hypothetical protein
MAHAREQMRFPKEQRLTLGVAAFSVAQMDAILDHVELLRRTDSSCEEFFSYPSHEPFFIKNLENVQGDERDVIFISIGYGPTREGYLAMNFGPLNRPGGERRLNVLISRARSRCEVFTALSADDIDAPRQRAWQLSRPFCTTPKRNRSKRRRPVIVRPTRTSKNKLRATWWQPDTPSKPKSAVPGSLLISLS